MKNALNTLLKSYRQVQGNPFLRQPPGAGMPLAIIGAGRHATSVLYPCLWHLGAEVKCICTAHAATAAAAAARWPNCRATDSLSDILNDDTIKAAVVCTEPAAQASITKSLLAARKTVYVEKPLGYSLDELNTVLAAGSAPLTVGFQRNFSPIALQTRKLARHASSYNYRFQTGLYPEGNTLYEIFIHPLAYLVHLFGEATLLSGKWIRQGSSIICQLHLTHEGVTGLAELSTAGNWNHCHENLQISTDSRLIRSNYPNELSATEWEKPVLGIPREKISNRSMLTRHYLVPDNFNTAPAGNSLYLQGFYTALETFLVNGKTGNNDHAERQKLLAVYRLLEQVQGLTTS